MLRYSESILISNHFLRTTNWFWTTVRSCFKSFLGQYRLVSSANKAYFNSINASHMSLMYLINSFEPSTEPYGTSYATVVSESALFIRTYCCLSAR